VQNEPEEEVATYGRERLLHLVQRSGKSYEGDKKATGNDYVSGDVLKLLGEDGLKVMTTHRNIYGTLEPPKDFTAVIIITFKKEAKSYKMQRPSQTSLNAHAEKVIVRILRRRIERKIEDLLGESDFDLRDEDELEM
jgi:hypothetical protein